MPYINVNDIKMYYEEWGKGVPLILLHGATGAVDDGEAGWGDLARVFASKYRVISIEHRGHGRTNNPRSKLSFELIADDVCKLIERLDLGSVHIGGISDGAIVGLHIGMTWPRFVRTLLCIGANYNNDKLCVEANQFFDVKKLERESYAAQFARLHDRNKSPGYWRQLVQQIAANLAVNPNYRLADLQEISAPTLLMAGENDLWGNHKQMHDMRKAIPNSEMLTINNADHLIHYTHPQIVVPIMLDFLARHGNNKGHKNSKSTYKRTKVKTSRSK
jgi:pimeloyl-ACP methyl ester carboxylesterase